MRKYYTILFLFISLLAFSQNNGINFQGVGRNSTGAVLATQKISLRFSVIQGSETGTVEYVESKEVTTNAQGIFSVVIGDGTQISKTGNFTDINWKINPKFLKVEMDPAGGSSFAAMGTTRLQSVPFAYYANGVNADNVDGVLSASKGGTGVASISALKTALGIDQVNNTSDLAKPISTATQAALDTKVSTATFSTTVATKANVADLALKAPIESPTFTGTVAGITKAMVELGSVDNTSDLAKPISTATQEALDTKVSTATFSTTMAIKANVADLALKAPLESPTFTGTVSGITQAMVGLSNVANTADLAKPISTATQEALDTKVSTATFSSTVATKENAANKSTATDLGAGATSDILFPTQKAVKTYVDTQVNAGGVADGGITTIKLADAAVTDEKVATGIDKTKVGLGNVDNIADALKPISTATQEALDEKLSTMVFDSRLRNIAKLDESNYFTSEQNIFSGNQIVIGELTLPNGILNLSAGTQILSGIDSPTTIQNRANTDFTIKTSINDVEYGDPGEYEFKFTANGRLVFPDGGSRIIIDESQFDNRDVFSIRSKTGGYIELKTTSEEEDHYWTFKDDGTLIFPNGTKIETGTETETIIRNPLNTDFSIISSDDYDQYKLKFTKDGALELDNFFRISTYGEINMRGQLSTNATIGLGQIPCPDCPEFLNIDHEEIINIGNLMEGTNWLFYKPVKALYFPNNSSIIDTEEGGFELNAYAGMANEEQEIRNGIKIFDKEVMISSYSDNQESYNYWKFSKEGKLTFPDGTTLAGNYSGSTYFELKTGDNDGFKIINGDDPANPKTWEFDLEGYLIFPGGDKIENDNYRFAINTENKRVEINISDSSDPLNPTSTYWKFWENGSLTFPDLTIAAGNISNTGNFGFDASPSNSGFSIITAGTTSGTTQLWKLGTDGGLTFPDLTIASGNISNTGKFGFDTRATENGFSIITGTASSSTHVWTFDTDGNLNLPVGGNIKIGGTSVLSNFLMEVFQVENVEENYTFPTNNRITANPGNWSVWEFELEHVPLANQTAFYINGIRARTNIYTITNNKLIIDMRIWDYPTAQSNYEFSIDYKY